MRQKASFPPQVTTVFVEGPLKSGRERPHHHRQRPGQLWHLQHLRIHGSKNSLSHSLSPQVTLCICRGPPENGRERPHHHRQRPFSLATSYPLYFSRASLCTLRGPPGSGRERPSGGRGDTATCLVTATADSTVNFCVSIRLITFVSLSQLCPISLDYPGFTFFTQGWLCAVKQGVRHLFGPRLPLTKSDIF